MVLGFKPVFSAISETVIPFTFQLSGFGRKNEIQDYFLDFLLTK
jgi:hypothetical protein